MSYVKNIYINIDFFERKRKRKRTHKKVKERKYIVTETQSNHVKIGRTMNVGRKRNRYRIIQGM